MNPILITRPAPLRHRLPALTLPTLTLPALALPVPALRLETVWARHADEVLAAQALRWQCHVDEMGARLQPLRGTPAGHDADLFDAHCEHLLARTHAADAAAAQVVGACRVLVPAAARRLGGLHSEADFDLVRLRALRPQLAEFGRACTHPRWRDGGVAALLWAELAAFLQREGLHGAVGCVSLPMRDGGRLAAGLWQQWSPTRLAPIELRVRPRLPLPLLPLPPDRQGSTHAVATPALMQAALDCGAMLLGPPAWNAELGTAQLPMLLRRADMPPA